MQFKKNGDRSRRWPSITGPMLHGGLVVRRAPHQTCSSLGSQNQTDAANKLDLYYTRSSGATNGVETTLQRACGPFLCRLFFFPLSEGAINIKKVQDKLIATLPAHSCAAYSMSKIFFISVYSILLKDKAAMSFERHCLCGVRL